ncbi:hypothetical protein ABZ671_04885 [Micromonospora sp. NPDC006766]|uniref:hypothetical protein n=1 Tax=Micromonospora sp. NPDC006766 TaxID=3154778 RepID=UPI0033DDD132
MIKLSTVRQGGRATLCVGGHNVSYRSLYQHDDRVLARRDHLLSGLPQRTFDAEVSPSRRRWSA